MKPPPFAYECPSDVAEAVALLAAHGGDARPLAGGQSLVPLAQLPPGAARGSGRSQPHRGARPDHGRGRCAPARCHGPPGCGRGRSGRGARLAAADRGHRSHRSSADSQPRYRRRQPRPQRSGGRAAGGDAGARCRNDPLKARTGATYHPGRRLLRRDNGDVACARRAAHRDQLFRHSPRAPAGAFRRPRAARGISRSWRSRSC